MSRIDLAPAQTTATGVRPSSSRSAEMSKVSSAPRWTPPMPPVANTWMPASAAICMVVATVVPAMRFCTSSAEMSRRLALAALPPSSASRSRSLPETPTWKRPSITAMVAGMAPSARITASTLCAISRFCG